MRLSTYTKIFPCKERPGICLLYSTARASLIQVEESLLSALENNTLSSEEQATLERLGFLVQDPVLERDAMLRFPGEVNRRSTMAKAMAVMNLDCNLACPYCFEEGIKGKHYMSRETAGLLTGFISHLRGPHKNLLVDFYGGEPLLSLGLIKDIAQSLKTDTEAAGKSFHFNLVTNGTLLTGKVARELAEIGLKSAKVTLDGPRENHDRFRPFKSGAGSFDTIVRNIKDACSVTEIAIGGNCTRENYREFPRLLDFLLKEGLTPDRIHLIKFDPIVRTAIGMTLPDFSSGCESINDPWLFEAGLFLREEVLKRGFHTPKMRPSLCSVEQDDNIVVNYDGGLYKCPALMGWKELEVGDLQTGIKDYSRSHRLDIWRRRECLECSYLPLCFGGCRYSTMLRNGKIDEVDCKKPNLDATLEALILQDLRYGPKGGPA